MKNQGSHPWVSHSPLQLTAMYKSTKGGLEMHLDLERVSVD